MNISLLHGNLVHIAALLIVHLTIQVTQSITIRWLVSMHNQQTLENSATSLLVLLLYKVIP